MSCRLVQAHAIARPIHEWLARDASSGLAVRGHVLASFERSCYVEFEQGLVAVLDRSLGRGAFAITLVEDVRLDSLLPGAQASLSRDALHVGDLVIDLSAAGELWDPTLPRLSGDAGPQIKVLRSSLLSMAPEEGLGRITSLSLQSDEKPLLMVARRALGLLRDGISRGDPSSIQSGAAVLAGLGPGLTPSGDDVLAGVLMALRVWPQLAEPLALDTACRLIVEAALPRTGKVSRAYLEAAGRGHTSEAWHHLISALSRDSDAVLDAARRIMRIGETSGADTLAGFLSMWNMRASQSGTEQT